MLLLLKYEKWTGDKLQLMNVVNTTISTDGTWQKRGFSSRNGVIAIIANSTGKCIENLQSMFLLERQDWCKNLRNFEEYTNVHSTIQVFGG